jgi:hypothetical protein
LVEVVHVGAAVGHDDALSSERFVERAQRHQALAFERDAEVGRAG